MMTYCKEGKDKKSYVGRTKIFRGKQ